MNLRLNITQPGICILWIATFTVALTFIIDIYRPHQKSVCR